MPVLAIYRSIDASICARMVRQGPGLPCHHCLSLPFPDNGYRECLANGSWAARVNYSECQEILNEEVRLSRMRLPV